MRNLFLLIMGLVCLLVFTRTAQAQDLQKKVSLKVEAGTLADVLQQIQEQYHVRFSYLNNELPPDTIRHFQVEEQPLGQVLDRLLEEAGTAYKVHGGQIIINKSFIKSAPPKKDKAGEEASTPPAVTQERGGNIPARQLELAQDTTAIRSNEKAEIKPVKTPPAKKEELTIKAIPGNIKASEIKDRPAEARKAAMEPKKMPRPDSTTIAQKARTEKQESDTSLRAIHLGIVYPLSTHGKKAPLYVNKFSLHLLVGIAAGLKGWEFSGIGNIEKDYVNGYQFAGIFNVVRNEVRGMQFSGLINKSGGSLAGGQFAGFLNYAGGDMKGLQAAGFMNRASSLKGSQLAGFLNVNSGEQLEGIQAAGFMNLSKGSAKGIQIAGFMNKADTLKGTQMAAFINKASKLRGLQTSGFINRASTVNGAQLGILNFSDTIEAGIPIGILSFVKKGYRALEVYGGDDFHANINFKTGVRRFYNILAIGYEINDKKRWGLGYGVGAEWAVGKSFSLNTDILSYHVIEDRKLNFEIGEAEAGAQFTAQNTLHKFRLLASLPIGRRISLFGGPTYNVFVSKYQEAGKSTVGSTFIQNAFYERIANNTNVKMWIGFNAGIRF